MHPQARYDNKWTMKCSCNNRQTSNSASAVINDLTV